MSFNESRRKFIKTAIALGVGTYGIYNLLGSLPSEAADRRPIVIVTRDKKVIDEKMKIDYPTLRKMLDDSMMKLAGTRSPIEAWKKFFRSDDIVGIKVNTLSKKFMSSHLELVFAIAEGLRLANVKDIVIWDKSDSDLQSAGFKINKKKTSNEPRCFGTLPDIGYENDVTVYKTIGSRLSRILSYCTAFVNVPVLKHHIMAGVTISMKNWFGAINNPHKYHFEMRENSKVHVAACKYIPDLNELIFSQLGKRQLIICDAIMAQYDNGPGYDPSKVWNYAGLLLSTDAVALDRVGTAIIERKRGLSGVDLLSLTGREPEYINFASKFNKLGTAELSKIEIISSGNLPPEI